MVGGGYALFLCEKGWPLCFVESYTVLCLGIAGTFRTRMLQFEVSRGDFLIWLYDLWLYEPDKQPDGTHFTWFM